MAARFVSWLYLETDRLWEEINNNYDGFSKKRPELGLFWYSQGVSVQQATISSGAHEIQECAPWKQPTLRLWHHHHLLHCSDSPVSCVTFSSIIIAKRRLLLVRNCSFDKVQPVLTTMLFHKIPNLYVELGGTYMDAMVQRLTYKKLGSECQGDPLHAPQPTPESPATKFGLVCFFYQRTKIA